MLFAEVIRNAIPDASDALCDHVLWSRTAFPVGPVDARLLFKAADRLKRAASNGIRLCDYCDRKLEKDFGACPTCTAVFATAQADPVTS